jgi:hypothetical protein
MKAKTLSLTLLILLTSSLLASLPVKNAESQEGDFIISVSPSRVTIDQEGIARYSIRLTSIGGYSGRISLDVIDLGAASSYSFQPSIIDLAADAEAYSVLVIVASSQSYYGNYPYTQYSYSSLSVAYTLEFSITASASGITKSAPVKADILYGYRDTRLRLNLQPATILLSGNISTAIVENLILDVTAQSIPILSSQTVTSFVPSFDITPELLDPPGGVTISFNPITAQIQSKDTLTFNGTLLMTPEFFEKAGTYRLAIAINALVRGSTSGYSYSGFYRDITLTKIAVVTIVVPPFFTVSAQPSIMDVFSGGRDQKMQITVSSVSRGLSQPITLTAEGIPQGVIANFESDTLLPKGREPMTTNLVFNAPSTFISGVFPIQIKATALGVTKIANASLYLRPKGDYAIEISQKTIALNTRGESRSITLTIIPLEGFRSTLDFSVTELPSGVRARVSPSNVTIQSDAPVSVILTLISEQYADPGTYNVAVISSTGVSSRTVNLNLLLRTGAGEIWPVVVLIGVVIGIASVIAFIGVPRGKHSHLIRD